MPSRSELVAYNRDTEAIAGAIGADLVIFQTLPDLISSVRQFNSEIKQLDCSVFNGEYITGGVDEAYLQYLEGLRSDNMKDKVQVADMGGMEGKGGGAVIHDGANGQIKESKEISIGCSGPMNGADDTVGLHNSWTVR